MTGNAHYTVDARTGSVNYNGPSEITRGNHRGMPPRNDAYLPGDERGHLQASSLKGENTPVNVLPQNADVNHKGYYAMEQGERNALRGDAQICSDKTAFVSNQPGRRPDAFVVNDAITYADGQKETIHMSFQNEAYTTQEAWNAQSASLPDTFDVPDPGDGLSGSMTAGEYSSLMTETDQALPAISDEYAQADFSGTRSDALDADTGINADASANDAGIASDAGESSADTGADNGADADSGAEADPD